MSDLRNASDDDNPNDNIHTSVPGQENAVNTLGHDAKHRELIDAFKKIQNQTMHGLEAFLLIQKQATEALALQTQTMHNNEVFTLILDQAMHNDEALTLIQTQVMYNTTALELMQNQTIHNTQAFSPILNQTLRNTAALERFQNKTTRDCKVCIYSQRT
ncbi:hypothetical protein B5S30_g5719 [[Candida] boidinii]|nr:hypothetical protein B5S30_g5719 [[Candida] boidinii]